MSVKHPGLCCHSIEIKSDEIKQWLHAGRPVLSDALMQGVRQLQNLPHALI